VHFLRHLRGHVRRDQHDALGAIVRSSSPPATAMRRVGGCATPSSSSSAGCRRSPPATRAIEPCLARTNRLWPVDFRAGVVAEDDERRVASRDALGFEWVKLV
jgi:hypothetical protein